MGLTSEKVLELLKRTPSEAPTPPALPAGPVTDADYRAALEKARKGNTESMRIVSPGVRRETGAVARSR